MRGGDPSLQAAGEPPNHVDIRPLDGELILLTEAHSGGADAVFEIVLVLAVHDPAHGHLRRRRQGRWSLSREGGDRRRAGGNCRSEGQQLSYVHTVLLTKVEVTR